MNKRFTLLFLSVLMAFAVNAQPFHFTSHTTSSDQLGTASGVDVVTDALGYSYVVGDYDNTVSFASLQIGGDFGTMFVAKYHPDGHPIWVRQINGSSNNHMVAVDIDVSGNLYVTGQYSHTNSLTELDFGTFSVTGNGTENTFVAKIDTSGAWQWVNTIVSTGPSAVNGRQVKPYDMVWTPSGLIMGGRVEEQVTVDNTTYNDINDDTFFFAKFDLDGNLTWFMPGAGLVFDLRLETGSNSLVYFTGNATSSGHSYDGNSISVQGSGDVVYGALTGTGSLSWWKTFGHMSYNEASNDIALDGDDNIYLTSSNPFTLTMEDTVVATIGAANWYLLKFNSTGDFQWMKPLASNMTGETYNILTTATGISYVTGYVEAPTTFWPAEFWGDSVGALGSKECYFAAYSSTGEYMDVFGFEFTDSVGSSVVREFIPGEMCFDNEGNIVMAGNWRGTIDFGDNGLLDNSAWPTQRHAFLIKADPQDLFDHTTGIADNHRTKPDFHLYPNPTADVLQVQGADMRGKTYRIINTLGATVQQGTFVSNNAPLSVQQLVSGMYFMEVSDGLQSSSLRFIKQ